MQPPSFVVYNQGFTKSVLVTGGSRCITHLTARLSNLFTFLKTLIFQVKIKFKSTFCGKWRKAFGVVLCGDPPEVSKWKSLFLTGAIVANIGIPFITFYQTMPYQGQIPPETSYAKNFGKIIFESENRGFKNYVVADFIHGDGKKFRLQENSISFSEIKEWVDRNPDKDIYVEGFPLRNGSGLFWIAFASTNNGYVLVTREKRSKSLAVRREHPSTRQER